jgi:hypothetical protein
VGGAAVVIDTEAARGAGGVEGVAWGAAEVMGAARGRPKSMKHAIKERRRSWQSDHPGWRFDRLDSRSDHPPLFRGRFDHLGSQSNRQPLFWVRSDHGQ